jgi:two-component system sensor histidine kinase PilS (NtrC family)
MFVPRALSHSDESNARRVVYLRLVVSTLIVGAAIMVLQIEDKPLTVSAMCGLLGVVYISSGSVFLAIKMGVALKTILRVLVALDIAVLTTLVHFSGGSGSFFSILFVLPVIVSGDNFGIGGGLAAAFAASVAYMAYMVIELSGYIDPLGGGWVVDIVSGGTARAFLRGYLNVAVFVFTGLVSGYVSSRLQNKREEIVDKEKEIRQIRLDTDSILKNMSSGLIVTDPDGVVLTVNPAAVSILGLGDTGLEGIHANDAFRSMPVLADELMFALHSGTQRQRHEIDVMSTGDIKVHLGISISLLKGEQEQVKGVIAIFQDLTEVKEMRERIRQADRMAAVGELSAAIAHEVRAPLASISGSIDMLKGEIDGLSGDNAELMDLIIRESERLDRIISDFLEYARLRKPSFSASDIARCLGEIAMLLRNADSTGKRIEIEVDCDCAGSRILADEEQIRQVFLNLGNNACEAMTDGGRLTLSVCTVKKRLSEERMDEECIEVRFHNNGPLIPEDVLPHVFEPFFTTRHGGTGLGLAIAARIVESHSGLIDVRSSEGAGTEFTVILPVRLDSDEAIEKEKVEITEEEHSMS